MPNERRTKILIRMHETTIIRFRCGEERVDVSACEQRVIQDEELEVRGPLLSSELPEPNLPEQSSESDE